MVIRTSSFFGPWDEYNFVTTTLRHLKEEETVTAAKDMFISPTYVPDLIHTSLDLLLDDEAGIFHVTNQGSISWADLAKQVAIITGYDEQLVNSVELHSMGLPAKRPRYSVLESEKGIQLPSVQNALERFLEAAGIQYESSKIAV